jgi:hypothetical protein
MPDGIFSKIVPAGTPESPNAVTRGSAGQRGNQL